MTVRVYSSISQDTTLAAGGISAVATSMTVATGTGNALMGGITLTAGDIFTVALDPDTTSEEIVYITAQASDTFTITRAQAGTSGVIHAAGATVRHVLSSDDLTYFRQGVETAQAAIPKADLTTKGDLISRTSSAVARLAVGANDYVLTADSTTSTGLKWAAASVPTLNLTFNAQTGTTYTLVAGDVNKLVTLSNAAAITLTIPNGVFTTGQQINIQQIGAGQVTIANDGTTSFTGTGTKLRSQYSAATIICTASNTFTVVGDLA
jgi:hypothetical protein